MAESSWPSAGPSTVDERMFELLQSSYYHSGVVGSPTDPPLVFADATGLQMKVRADRYALVRGFAWASGPADVALSVSANTSGSARVDLVVLRLDRSTWEVAAEVVEGTPGAGAPTVETSVGDTGSWDLVVGMATIPTGTTATVTAGMVVSRPPHLGPQLLLANSGAWPATNLPSTGLQYQPDVDRLVLNRPSGSVDLWRDSGRVTLSERNSAWAVDNTSWLWRRGTTVTFSLGTYVRESSTDLSGGQDSRLPPTIPAGFRVPGSDGSHAVAMAVGIATTTGRFGRVVIYPEGHSSRANQVWLLQHAGVQQGWPVRGCNVAWEVST